MQIRLTKSNTAACWTWSISATGCSTLPRGTDRFSDYDEVEGLLFTKAPSVGMPELIDTWPGGACPSRAFVTGGIHEAIGEYEDAMFFDILAEELARRDMNDVPIDESNFDELVARVEAYLAEFELHGTDNVQVTTDD